MRNIGSFTKNQSMPADAVADVAGRVVEKTSTAKRRYETFLSSPSPTVKARVNRQGPSKNLK